MWTAAPAELQGTGHVLQRPPRTTSSPPEAECQVLPAAIQESEDKLLTFCLNWISPAGAQLEKHIHILVSV